MISPEPPYPVNVPFRPSPALKISLALNILVFLLFTLGIIVVPVLAAEHSTVAWLACILLVIAAVALCIAWVILYYESMWYELRDDEISWKRGIWFRTTGIVPFNRITNLDVRQGPVMRVLGISTLAIQTAGYSGQTTAEIKMEGMERADPLREFIRSKVRQSSAHGDGTGGEKVPAASTDRQILAELTRIRQILEEQKK